MFLFVIVAEGVDLVYDFGEDLSEGGSSVRGAR